MVYFIFDNPHLTTTIRFSSTIVLPLPGCHVSGRIMNVASESGFFYFESFLGDPLVLLCVLLIYYYFLLLSGYFILQINLNLFFYKPIEGHLGYFKILVIMDKAAVNIDIYFFGGEHKFSFLFCKYIGVGLLGCRVSVCWTLFKNFQNIFQSGWVTLYSQPQCMRIPVALHPCQTLIMSVLFILAILIWM